MFQSFINSFCWNLTRWFPRRVRVIDVDGEMYLLRFYIKHNGLLPGLYLHKFYQGDAGRDLHNHPWLWSFSLILTGGYLEERAVFIRQAGGCVVLRRQVNPGRINLIKGDDFHRIHLTDPDHGAWTLFCSGPEVKDWGFMDRDTGKYVPHVEYFTRRQ